MLHIKKSKDGKFYVVATGSNSEPLTTSEMLKSKQAAWVNIKAQSNNFQLSEEGHYVYVVDETVSHPVVKMYDLNKKAK